MLAAALSTWSRSADPSSAARRAHRDEDDGAVRHRRGGVGGEVQAAGGGIAQHQLRQAGLVNRNLALVQAGDARCIDVDARHAVAHLGQARARHQADVAGAEHADLHGVSKG